MAMDQLLRLEILEEPVSSFRFRYDTEKHGAHGHIAGESSQKSKKTLPKVRINGCPESSAFIRCTLATVEEDKEHPNRLVVRNKKKDIHEPHIIEVHEENNWEAEFKVGILSTVRRQASKVLKSKKLMRRKFEYGLSQLTSKEIKQIEKEAESEARTVDLNSVRLRFEALSLVSKAPFVDSLGNPLVAFSRPILNKKCTANAELKIAKASVAAGTCRGNTEIMIFVDKVDKKNVKIRFFDEDEDGETVWEDYGTFNECDVHYQYGIVFFTPPYWNPALEDHVDVFYELVRPSDYSKSAAMPFRYLPEFNGCICKKRKYDEEMDLGVSFNPLEENIHETSAAASQTAQLELATLCSGGPSTIIVSSQLAPQSDMEIKRLLDLIEADGVSRTKAFIEHSEIIQERIWACIVAEDTSCLKDMAFQLGTEIRYMFLQFNHYGKSAIHIATATGNQEILSFLLLQNVNACVAEKSGGLTPLHIAAQGGHEACVKLLVREAAAAIDVRDWKGLTALHYAVGAGHGSICEVLLDAESDPETPNYEGQTPLELALGNEALEQVFSKYVDMFEDKIAAMKIGCIQDLCIS